MRRLCDRGRDRDYMTRCRWHGERLHRRRSDGTVAVALTIESPMKAVGARSRGRPSFCPPPSPRMRPHAFVLRLDDMAIRSGPRPAPSPLSSLPLPIRGAPPGARLRLPSQERGAVPGGPWWPFGGPTGRYRAAFHNTRQDDDAGKPLTQQHFLAHGNTTQHRPYLIRFPLALPI